MLDILTIVHSFADIQTASRIRRTCRRLAILAPEPILYNWPSASIVYEYRVGSKLHRPDGPAQEDIHGYTCWYRGGIQHREYHPQIISRSYVEYNIEGLHHREAGPSIVHYKSVRWYLRAKLHRKIGPADTQYGQKWWFTLGKLHRLDGPVHNNLYMIRGVEHSIFCLTRSMWVVDGVFIRGSSILI